MIELAGSSNRKGSGDSEDSVIVTQSVLHGTAVLCIRLLAAQIRFQSQVTVLLNLRSSLADASIVRGVMFHRSSSHHPPDVFATVLFRRNCGLVTTARIAARTDPDSAFIAA